MFLYHFFEKYVQDRYMAMVPCLPKRLTRITISLLIVYHLSAVVLPPLSLQAHGPGGLSPFIAFFRQPIEAYCRLLYIDRGYAFFAPDPGPSHLLQVRVEEPNGDYEEYLYPDSNRQWPRLLYHRHFMLTEYLHEIYRPKMPSDSGNADLEFRRMRAERERYDQVLSSYAKHLQHVHRGRRISIRRLEHLLPQYDQYVVDPKPLNDPLSYRVLRDVSGVRSNNNGAMDLPSNLGGSAHWNEAKKQPVDGGPASFETDRGEPR